MQDKVLAIVDLINTGHKGGVDYGTGDRLSPVEAHTIQAVGDNQGLNLTALARAMNVTKATMSERVKKLARKGLLRKSKALDNRKEILITLAAVSAAIILYTLGVRYVATLRPHTVDAES